MARATATATSRRALAHALVAGAVLGGCGSSGSHTASAPGAAKASGSFAWLTAGPAPAGWPTVRILDGAAMAYPPSWRLVKGDRGTATVVLLRAPSTYLGYLNLTPRQATETLSGWSAFRVEHNAEEGDRAVRQLAAAQGLRFRTGHGSCVRDSYVTKTGVRYIELACLVSGPSRSSVIVGAAPPASWPSVSPLIERAISALIT